MKYFKVGDRVKHIDRGLGTVIALQRDDYGCIEYDKRFSSGHDGNEVPDINGKIVKGREGHCYWTYSRDVSSSTLISPRKVKPKKEKVQKETYTMIEIFKKTNGWLVYPKNASDGFVFNTKSRLIKWIENNI